MVSKEPAVRTQLRLAYTALMDEIRSEGLPVYHWRSPVRRTSFQILEGLLTVVVSPELVCTWETNYPEAHAKLVAALDKQAGIPKTRLRLHTFLSFAKHGSFRQVAAELARVAGDPCDSPDQSGPISQVRKLGETLDVVLTRLSDDPGRRRSELTEAGSALADWLRSHPQAIA